MGPDGSVGLGEPETAAALSTSTVGALALVFQKGALARRPVSARAPLTVQVPSFFA